jgi:GT2 family glycosyltransferase
VSTPTLNIIIVSYNVCELLEQCLYSVVNASKNISTHITVVDNNSSDASVNMVEKKFPFVSIIKNTTNKGFSAANNQAIKSAKGDYILLLNPDTVVKYDTLYKSISFMQQHPDAGALGVKMFNGEGDYLPESKRGLPTPWVAFCKMSGLSGLFPTSKLFNNYYLGHLDNDGTHEVEVLAGAFMLIQKKVLDKIGLLDERFFMYGEDIDLSYRITQAGYKNHYFPEVSIIHYKGKSSSQNIDAYINHFYGSMIIFYKKHFMKSQFSLSALVIIGGIKLLYYSLRITSYKAKKERLLKKGL